MPRLSLSATPKVHQSVDVHEFSYVEGDVSIAADAKVSPGTAITADQGASVVIREGCALLPGVLVEGTGGPKVTGLDSSACSVFLGARTTLAHKAVVHSPAFIGEGCFVGFRSTIYNARLGDGCVVMMHALIQDVEVPPGKCVPSGSVITSQHQADQLPNVRAEDLEFAREIVKSSLGASSNRSNPRLVPIRGSSPASPSQTGSPRSRPTVQAFSSSSANAQPSYNSTRNSSYDTEGANMQMQRLSPEIVQQVRQYLSQGYRLGMEHADKRRYRSGVWETCTPIKDTREQAVFEALERCLAEHMGEYVRMFGIDPQMKRRVGMVTVQRPDGQAVSINAKPAAGANGGSGYGNSASSYTSNDGGSSGGGLTTNVVEQVRNLLRGGFLIGTEHADARRYRSNVWKSCSPIQSTNERDVLAHLEHCLAEHSGEYVRMFGIDPKAKCRIAPTTIQRADGKPVDTSGTRMPAVSASRNQSYGSSQNATPSGYSSGSSAQGGGVLAQAVNQILSQGNQVGVEVADARRYRSGIWQTAPSVQSASQLQNFLTQNADKYVRIFGVNKAQKTRGSSTTIQKPGQSAPAGQEQSSQRGANDLNANPPHYDDPAFVNRNNGNGYSNGYGSNSQSNGSGTVDSEVMNQVTQLVNQGCRIAIEFADKRRFRSGIWQTGPSIDARRPAEAISALGQQLAAHSGDYVRLVGVDPQAKRRVLETTIQRP
ncbi:MAG: ribulose bisphosphate carboxylase small subunit [Cyanobacteria bacterium P01_D01_bin.105]